MQLLKKSEQIPGDSYQLHGNQSFLLNDSHHVWLIESGAIALFMVTVIHGEIEGPRQYLFTASAGEALFGTMTPSKQSHRQLLAVPVEETSILNLDSTTIQSKMNFGNTQLKDLIESWINRISHSIEQGKKLANSVCLLPEKSYSVDPGDYLRANTIAWIQIHEGTLNWLGLETAVIDATAGYFPISDRLWLQASESVQLKTKSTDTIQQVSDLLNGLAQLHQCVFQAVEKWEQEQAAIEALRLQAQEQLNRQVTADALSELASTLGRDDFTHLSEDSPPLLVAGIIGKALGTPIRPPAQADDPKRVRDPLEAIMRASRIRMRSVLLRDAWWQKDCGPLAAYTRQTNELVALIPVSATRYDLFNPHNRTRTVVNEALAATLNPVAFMFYRSLPDQPIKAPALIRFALQKSVRDLLLIVVTGIAATLLGMLTPQAIAILIDTAIPDGDRGLLFQVGLGLLVAAIGTALFRLAQGLAILRVETISDATTQAAVWNRVLSLPVSFFRQYTTGDLQSRVTSISQIRRQLSGSTVINLVTALFALLNLGLLFRYSVKLAFIAVAVALIAIAVTSISGFFLIRKTRPLLEMQGDIFGQTVQLINGISKLRVAGAEERAFANWSKRYSQQIKLDLSTQRIEDGVALFNTVMPTLTSAVLFWFTLQLLTDNQAPGAPGAPGLTVGAFLAFNSAFGTFIRGATDLSNTLTNVLDVIPQAKRAQPILETVPEVDLTKADPGKLAGRITVDHITFRYRDDGPLTLDDVSLQAEPGEFIALVGGSGSGKSTLFRLLLGFEAPESGSIYYDGQDLTGLDIEAVRRQLGVVLQSGRIMSASIFDNIASGAQITLDEAWEAARMAGFEEDVRSMPMEMHTVISEGGGNLSGGQRQRMLIARALVLKPKILLFDEATSALDNRTQAIVSESLDRLQVTRLVIAHRLSTIRNADRIYVLQSGRMIQQGSFDELANQDGLFAQLMKRQMG